MSNVVTGTIKYYDVGDKPYKGGARHHKLTLNVGGAELRTSAFVQSTEPLKGAKPGDTVKTVVVENDRGYKNFDSEKFKILERGTAQAGNQGGSTLTNKDASIARQNAVHGASRVVAALAHSGLYSSSDEAAADLVRIAENYVMPYGLEGKLAEPEQNEKEPEPTTVGTTGPTDDFNEGWGEDEPVV